jgi:hypothetical protein
MSAILFLVKRFLKKKEKKSVLMIKNSENSKNSTTNFPLMTLKTEEKAMSSLVTKRLITAKRMKSSLQLKLELLQEENQVFNSGDSIINMCSNYL